MSASPSVPLPDEVNALPQGSEAMTKDPSAVLPKEGFLNTVVRYFALSEDGREQRAALETCFRGCYPTMRVLKDELVKVLRTNSKYGKDAKFTTHEFVTGVIAAPTNDTNTGADSTASGSIAATEAVPTASPAADVWMTYDEIFAQLAQILGWDEAKQERLRKSLRIAELCFLCPSTWVPTIDFVTAVQKTKMFGEPLTIDFVPHRLKTLSARDREAGIKLPFTSHPIFFNATPERVTENQVITLFNRYFDFSTNVTDMDRKFFKLQEDQYNKLNDKASSKTNKQRAVLATAVPFKKFADVLKSTSYGAEVSLDAEHWKRWKSEGVISWEEAYRGIFQSLCPKVVSVCAATAAVQADSGASNADRAAQVDAKVDQIIAAAPRPAQVEQAVPVVAENQIAGASVITSADVLSLKQALSAAKQEIEGLKAAQAAHADLKKENSKLMATIQSYARQLKNWQQRASTLGAAVTNQQNGLVDSRSVLSQVVDAVTDVVVDAAAQMITHEIESVIGNNTMGRNAALTAGASASAQSSAPQKSAAPQASAASVAAKPAASIVVAQKQIVHQKRSPVIITSTTVTKPVPVVFRK
jgi:hypothetical protein